jgi:hypothetical protein
VLAVVALAVPVTTIRETALVVEDPACLAGHLSIAAEAFGLLALSLPLSAILAVRMANATANVIAAATIMSLVIMEGPLPSRHA